eukprot:CAMPEP_0204841402 /NCGR_PEP_ID=MMETSP1346-20131115/41821_1 /ASSEMBLY_ACC=CAM_ASM_000771 /TAXON_ID=215587 /ORGANISM="Aplanochytrium stocchinoi, Strain GSBS06" /LENGTH=570 /DNA_ID=CAMNT_0051979499 /DNA_START=152 /DNA_END=1864 /DNA_ORIENTATION=+
MAATSQNRSTTRRHKDAVLTSRDANSNANLNIGKGIINYEALSRKELQSLAKQNGIKANLKSKDIIQVLREKTSSAKKSNSNPKKRGLSVKAVNDENQDPQILRNKNNAKKIKSTNNIPVNYAVASPSENPNSKKRKVQESAQKKATLAAKNAFERERTKRMGRLAAEEACAEVASREQKKQHERNIKAKVKSTADKVVEMVKKIQQEKEFEKAEKKKLAPIKQQVLLDLVKQVKQKGCVKQTFAGVALDAAKAAKQSMNNNEAIRALKSTHKPMFAELVNEVNRKKIFTNISNDAAANAIGFMQRLGLKKAREDVAKDAAMNAQLRAENKEIKKSRQVVISEAALVGKEKQIQSKQKLNQENRGKAAAEEAAILGAQRIKKVEDELARKISLTSWFKKTVGQAVSMAQTRESFRTVAHECARSAQEKAVVKSTMNYIRKAQEALKRQDKLKKQLEENRRKRKNFEVYVDQEQGDVVTSDSNVRDNKRRRESIKEKRETHTRFVKEVLDRNAKALTLEKENIAPGASLPVEESSLWFTGESKSKQKGKTISLRQQTEQEDCSAAKRRKIR